MPPRIFFVGTAAEVTHHQQPLARVLAVEQIEPSDVAAVAQPGDLAIFFSEHFDRFRQAIMDLKKRQVATLYLIDGILEWRNAWLNRDDEPACPWTMRPVLADKVACIGYQQARVLSGWGNQPKIEIVGIPRLDGLAETASPRNEQGPWRLLVATAKCPGFTADQQQITRRSLSDLKSFLDRKPVVGGREIQVRWRLTADLASQLKIDNQLSDLTGCELAAQIRDSDAVITTPSTTMLESMLLSRPTALLDYHAAPQWSPAVWNVTHAGQFTNVFEQMVAPQPMQWYWQQELLRDQLLMAEPATDRLRDLVQMMLSCAAKSLAKSAKLEFPAQLLREPRSESLGFDHSALFPRFSEFRNADLLELQSQLAHSRREIKHLQSQISQLQLELGEAHEIFEQIHRHPVAGPIVRGRQRLLDWWSSWQRHRAAANSPGS